MSSTTSTTTITDAAVIQGYNRGPIPTVFAAPTSCLSTISSVAGGVGYFGHNDGGYLDPLCYPPTTTTNTAANTDAVWNLYYCLYPPSDARRQTDLSQIVPQFHVHQAGILPLHNRVPLQH
jgi:hypothetical protein